MLQRMGAMNTDRSISVIESNSFLIFLINWRIHWELLTKQLQWILTVFVLLSLKQYELLIRLELLFWQLCKALFLSILSILCKDYKEISDGFLKSTWMPRQWRAGSEWKLKWKGTFCFLSALGFDFFFFLVRSNSSPLNFQYDLWVGFWDFF